MAEKKKRKIITAAEAKTGKKVTPKATAKSEGGGKKSSKGLRIGAIILWVLAIGFEVAAIYMFNLAEETLLIVALVLDAACCIVGSILWKKANRISPCKSKSKFVCFIWNQLGVIVCLIAFIPFGIYLIKKADQLSPKMKTIIVVLTAALFLGSVGGSIDYKPVTAESIEQAKIAAEAQDPDFDGIVYWTRWGKSYHLDQDCHTLTRSEVLISGTLEEALEAKRNDPCDFCALDWDEVSDTSGDDE